MPMELLLSLAQSNLPLTMEDINDIDKLRVLKAAHLVDAQLPQVQAGIQQAQVLAITAEGRAALCKRFPDAVYLPMYRAAVA